MEFSGQHTQIARFESLSLLAHQVVEGFISGMHKSPFHGFSAEFAEHKLYNKGESTRHIDWKLFARTNRLYTKRYDEETNLRCHLIIDNSASMHYPELSGSEPFYHNKIGFSVLASAVLMNILKRQRDAVGLSVYSDSYEYYAPEKGSDRHHNMLLDRLGLLLEQPAVGKQTDTVTYLHQIAEKIHRRSMIVLFSDLFQNGDQEALFDALKHLKYNKHKVIVFHPLHAPTELHFDYGSQARQFIDVETGEKIQVFADNVRESYQKQMKDFMQQLQLRCAQYRIQYVPVEVGEQFEKIMLTYLIERQRFG